LLPRNRVLRHCSDPPPSAPDFATAIVVLPARHRQCIHPPEHLAKQTPVQMPLGKQQPIIAWHELPLTKLVVPANSTCWNR